MNVKQSGRIEVASRELVDSGLINATAKTALKTLCGESGKVDVIPIISTDATDSDEGYTLLGFETTKEVSNADELLARGDILHLMEDMFKAVGVAEKLTVMPKVNERFTIEELEMAM